MLVAEYDGARVEAATAPRGLSYYCPECRGDVVLKQGQFVCAHFAHKAGIACNYSTGETEDHLYAKRAFCDEFRRRGFRADVEVPIRNETVDRRADVLVTLPSGKRAVVEVQHSPIDLDLLYARSMDYARQDICQLWVPIIRKNLSGKWKPGKWCKDSKIVDRGRISPYEEQMLYYQQVAKHEGHTEASIVCERALMWCPIAEGLRVTDVSGIEKYVPYNGWGGGYTKLLKKDRRIVFGDAVKLEQFEFYQSPYAPGHLACR